VAIEQLLRRMFPKKRIIAVDADGRPLHERDRDRDPALRP
jgi:hypothetical protein